MSNEPSKAAIAAANEIFGMDDDELTCVEWAAKSGAIIDRHMQSQPCENCKETQRALTQVARENRSLEKRCVSLAAAEARGYAEAIEQAAGVAATKIDSALAQLRLNGIQSVYLFEVDSLRTQITADIRNLSPIPNQVEAERKRIKEAVAAVPTSEPWDLPGMQLEQDGSMPHKARTVGEYSRDVLAAIDAKEGN